MGSDCPVPETAPAAEGAMPSPPPSSFGELLRRYRRAAGLTQEALAERAGLSARAISDLDHGFHHAPQRQTVQLLLDALGPVQCYASDGRIGIAVGRGFAVPRRRVGVPAEGGGWGQAPALPPPPPPRTARSTLRQAPPK